MQAHTPSVFSRRAFLGGLAAAPLVRPAAPARPNIIFLLFDDLGWSDLGCYGNTFHDTPNIDRLAAEGVRFTNAYAACPVCSPTRASIMTGKYPARLHLTDWIPGRRSPHARLRTPAFEQHLPLAEVTVAEALKPLGYRTASIGKWHLGGKGYWPDNQGFDLNVAGTDRGSPKSYFGPFELPDLEGGTPDDYLTEKLTAAAESFLGECARAGAPFFLYLPEFAVHIPLQARVAAVEKYKRKNGGRSFPNPVYGAMVESVDIALGSLRETLERLRLAENTVIIVNSDNGGLRYEGKARTPVTDNHPLRAGKGHLYEGGIREPLIVHWPGVTRPGSVVDTPVSSVDYLSTLLEVAGGSPRPARSVDGVSLAPLLRGGAPAGRDTLYWHYPHYSNQGGVPGGAVRSGDWKLIEFYEDHRLELFHLPGDPGERKNLVRAEPKKAAELAGLLRNWRLKVNAAMPVPNPDYDPALDENTGLTGAERPTPPV